MISNSRPEFPDEASIPVAEEAANLKNAFIQDYGLGYQSFGLPRLMGQVVGLLLYHDKAISLNDITEELQVSKGPVSQIMSRLREHNLVRRVWVPGSRRDYYEAVPDIFGQAFANHTALQQRNLELANKYAAHIADSPTGLPAGFAGRMDEMKRFYTMMNRHLKHFRDEWQATQSASIAAANSNQEDES